MTFAGLKAILTDFDPHQAALTKAFEGGKFGELEDAEDITDVFFLKAKQDILVDLQSALKLNPQIPADMAVIDLITDAQAPILRRALAYKQTAMMFEILAKKEGSLFFRAWEQYVSKYETERRGFSGLPFPYGSSDVEIIQLR